MSLLDKKCAELAKKYLPLGCELLKEAVRIPADTIAENPLAGQSGGEGTRLEYLKKRIIEIGAVDDPKDVYIDEFGNLVWHVWDKEDGIPMDEKKVIYFDGHTDTVAPLREQWHKTIGGGIDPFNGLTDITKVNEKALINELNWMIPKEEWEHCIFGRGTADQLTGVISQIVSSKIMLELKKEGALKGVIIRSYGTASEEDNDGGGAMYIARQVLPGAKPNLIPDCVIMTEGTGSSELGSVAIYRGQRGRMQIEVEVIGRSCHGSMPWEGLNPLEYGSLIIKEAAEQYKKLETFGDDPFLGKGSRTVSECKLDTPSDCAVPSRFVFRFDRRMTAGEDPKDCVAAIANLPAVAKAREAGLTVNVYVPKYSKPSHVGYVLNNDQIYMGWVTPEDHPTIKSAVSTYKSAITPYIRADLKEEAGRMRREPRVGAWIFSTDGVGYPVRAEDCGFNIPESKKWIKDGNFTYPPMFGIGVGIEHHCHKIGEYIDSRDLEHVLAFMARFPSKFREENL
eukprot:GCRY01000930.1.p1 GENE.GCRY01000930.1~~GCRY01000930.1.p1  ORF type:complete len:510 (+),score=134.36 GCRY01000930.1:36-1565(+)